MQLSCLKAEAWRGLALAATLLGTACHGADARGGSCEPLLGGVAIVSSSGEGEWGAAPRRLTEVWRAGGVREGEELAFPNSIVASTAGRLAIADFQLAEVIIVEPDGAWTGPVARRGRGPGEYAHPLAVAWSEDGSLTVFDVFGAKAVTYGAGAPVELPLAPTFTGLVVEGGSLNWAGTQPNGAALLIGSPTWSEQRPGEALFTLLRLAPGASEPDTLLTSRQPGGVVSDGLGPVTGPGWPKVVAAAGAGDRLAVAGADASYRVLVLDGDGRPVFQLCRTARALRPLPEPPRGDTGTVDVLESARPAPPPQPAAVASLFTGADGSVWVGRDHVVPHERRNAAFGRPGGRFDVFAADGRYLGLVQPPPGVQLVAAAGDRVYGVRLGDLDETWLLGFRLDAAP